MSKVDPYYVNFILERTQHLHSIIDVVFLKKNKTLLFYVTNVKLNQNNIYVIV